MIAPIPVTVKPYDNKVILFDALYLSFTSFLFLSNEINSTDFSLLILSLFSIPSSFNFSKYFISSFILAFLVYKFLQFLIFNGIADADTDADGKVINEFTYWSNKAIKRIITNPVYTG